MSQLWQLCPLGQVDLVKEALERGEDVNSLNEAGQTVLMCLAASSFWKNLLIIKLLLKQPAIEVNIANKTGLTALHIAADSGNIEAVKLLLADKRVNVNCKDSEQMTPLLRVSHQGDRIEIFKLLLADGRVDVNSKDSCQRTPLFVAVTERNEIEILKLLLSDQRVDMDWQIFTPTLKSFTALMWAMVKSNVEAVKLLLENPRVNVNQVDSRGTAPLHIASQPVAQGVDPTFLELFLAHPRMDVNCKQTSSGMTALHAAVSAENNVESVRLILAEPRFTSANERTTDSENQTAVDIAASERNWDALRYLAQHPKIDLDVKDEKGLGIDDMIR